jgi:hypothetical protein
MRCPNVIKLAIEKGADIKHPCEQDGWFPAHQVMKFCISEEICKFVTDKHCEAGLDLFAMTKQGTTVFDHVLYKLSGEIILYALSKINIQSDDFTNRITTYIDAIGNNSGLTDENKELIINAFFG